jgi:hypothetical protein
MHDNWILIRLINWHVNNSTFPVISDQVLDIIDALHVNVHALHLLPHDLGQNVEGGPGRCVQD